MQVVALLVKLKQSTQEDSNRYTMKARKQGWFEQKILGQEEQMCVGRGTIMESSLKLSHTASNLYLPERATHDTMAE